MGRLMTYNAGRLAARLLSSLCKGREAQASLATNPNEVSGSPAGMECRRRR